MKTQGRRTTAAIGAWLAAEPDVTLEMVAYYHGIDRRTLARALQRAGHALPVGRPVGWPFTTKSTRSK